MLNFQNLNTTFSTATVVMIKLYFLRDVLIFIVCFCYYFFDTPPTLSAQVRHLLVVKTFEVLKQSDTQLALALLNYERNTLVAVNS